MWKDLLYGFRALRRSPALTTAAVLSLALGIGANTAIFSLLDQVVLRSLPVADPERLVALHGSYSGRASLRPSGPPTPSLLSRIPFTSNCAIAIPRFQACLLAPLRR